MVTSAHVLFDEVLPTPSTTYHAELEELARVKVVPGEGRAPESYSYLINTRHRNDEDNLLYEVKILAISREGWIVAYRSLVTNSGVVSREEKVSIHVADIHRMTADLRLSATSEPELDGALGPSNRARGSRPARQAVSDRASHPDEQGAATTPLSQGQAGATNTSRRRNDILDSRPGCHSRKDLASNLSCSGPCARINLPRECKRPVVYALLYDQQGEHHTIKTYGQAMKAEDAAQ